MITQKRFDEIVDELDKENPDDHAATLMIVMLLCKILLIRPMWLMIAGMAIKTTLVYMIVDMWVRSL